MKQAVDAVSPAGNPPSGLREGPPGPAEQVPAPSMSPGGVTLVEAIRLHKGLVLLFGVGTAALIAAFTWLTTPAATAQGQLGLVSPATGNVLLPLPTGDATMARYTAQRALFAKSDAVLQQVADSVDVPMDQLRGSISVVASKTANAILITASSDTPERAVGLTTALMAAYRAQTAKDVTARSAALAKGYEARGDAAKAEQVQIDGEAFADGVEFEVSANENSVQTKQVLTKESVLGLLVGLGIGGLVAWSIEDGRQRRSQLAARGLV